MRIGQGYDIHATKPGDGFPLGGVLIPSDMALKAHSDGDVLLHAVIDALMGALSMGDIGEWFPDSSAEFENIDSKVLLQQVYAKVKEKGWQVGNIDTTLILEKPKLAPYKQEIVASLATLLEIDISAVSVKAKTKEKMDATGEGKAVEAFCVLLLSENK